MFRAHHVGRWWMLAIASAVACSDGVGPIDDLPRQLSVAERELIESDNRFAFTLFREIDRQDDAGGNVFVSPLSVAMALGMAYNGAAGTTRDAMREILGLDGLTISDVNASYRSLIDLLRGLDATVEFGIANSVWYDLGETLRPSFLDVVTTYFDAEAAGLDFTSAEAAPTINAWVSEATHGRIPEIANDPIPGGVVAYLINAIYFKGAWTYQFDQSRTRTQAFHLPDGSDVDVDMMSYAAESPVRFAVVDGVQIVDLAYGGGAYSMTIVLPSEVDAADALAGSVTQAQWTTWVEALDSTNRFVSLPRFTLEWEDSLNGVLMQLGMEEALCPNPADFSNMFVEPGPCISNVKHKTFVDVNEEGTEAAAATSVEFIRSGSPSTVIDRPFLFAIRERLSGTILFMGKIVDPR